MPPTVTILSPREGDTVNYNNVVISAAFAGFPNPPTTTALKCKIETKPDTPENVSGSGLHTGSKIMGVTLGYQTVKAWTADEGNPHAQEDNILVIAGLLPLEIGGGVFLTAAGTRSLKKVKVTVPANSGGSYVLVQVLQVNGTTGQTATKAAGATTITKEAMEKEYQVDLNTEVALEAGFYYVARAYIHNRDFRLLASTSQVVT